MNGFYWIYLAVLALLIAYDFAKTDLQKKMIYWGGWAFLILIFTVQDKSVSIDIAEYMRQFELLPALSLGEMLTHKFEIGYLLLCRVVQCLFASDRVLLLALALLIYVPFARYLEKETEAPMVALMAFLALGMFIHTVIFWRQFCAIALLTFSFRYIRERKPVPFALILLGAMCFHKASVVFAGLYLVYNIPIRKGLLIACGAIAAVLGLFGNQIIEFGISHIYTRYWNFPRMRIGGGTLLAVMWIVVLMSYWMLGDRLQEPKIRMPFLMVLIAATIQPVCFAFYNWLRIVLFFRVALVPLSAELYVAMFQRKTGNRGLDLLGRLSPKLHHAVLSVYDTKWFAVATKLVMFAVLFLWYVDELDGAVYVMAPI